jgi:hypothetical protein
VIKIKGFTDFTNGEQRFTLTIPFEDLGELDIDPKWWNLITETNNDNDNPAIVSDIIRMLLKKIEDRKDLTRGEKTNG